MAFVLLGMLNLLKKIITLKNKMPSKYLLERDEIYSQYLNFNDNVAYKAKISKYPFI